MRINNLIIFLLLVSGCSRSEPTVKPTGTVTASQLRSDLTQAGCSTFNIFFADDKYSVLREADLPKLMAYWQSTERVGYSVGLNDCDKMVDRFLVVTRDMASRQLHGPPYALARVWMDETVAKNAHAVVGALVDVGGRREFRWVDVTKVKITKADMDRVGLVMF